MASTVNSGVSRNDIQDVLLNGKFKNIITVVKSGRANFVCTDYDSDDECIQAAIDYCANNNIKEIWILSGIYNIQSQLLITHDLDIFGIGIPEFQCNIEDTFILNCTGIIIDTIACTNDVLKGESSATVSNSSDINIGDVIILYDDTIWCPEASSTWKQGEIHKVKDIDNCTVYFSDITLNTYTLENNISILIARPITINIQGIKITASSTYGKYDFILYNYVTDSTLKNCIFDYGWHESILIQNSYNVNISECSISNCEYIGTGYGVMAGNACNNINVHNNDISSCRHCIASGGSGGIGQVRNYNIFNNTIHGGSSWAVDAHQMVESMYVYDNIIYTEYNFAFVSSAKRSSFKNNYVYGGNGCGLRGYVHDIIFDVDNNNFDKCGNVLFDIPAYNPGTSNSEKYISIKNNTVTSSTSCLADLSYATTIDIENNFIDSGVITGIDVMTFLDDCSSTDGWEVDEGTVSNISIEDGSIKVVGTTSENGILSVKKTFSQSFEDNNFISYSIRCSIAGWPRFFIYDSNSNYKSWTRTGVGNRLIENEYKTILCNIRADRGDISILPYDVEDCFLLDTLTKISVGIYYLTPGTSVTYYIDNIYIRSGYTSESTSIKIKSASSGHISNNTILNSYGTGINLVDCSNLSISNNLIQNSNRANSEGYEYESGISLMNCTGLRIFKNYIQDDDNIQNYSIAEYGSSNSNIVTENYVSSSKIIEILKSGSDTKIQNNIGYTTENTGTATITAGQTSVDINHGLAATPTRVLLTPTTSTSGKIFYVSAKEASTFTITIDSAAGSDISFDWQAIV